MLAKKQAGRHPVAGPLDLSRDKECTYSTAGGLLVAALASDLEGNIVGGVALDLDGAGRQVVEVLVQQLERGTNC